MDKDETLLRCSRTFDKIENIIKTLKEAEAKDLPALVEAIDLKPEFFDHVRSEINRAIMTE